ncbi:MAG TPA: hypothetical protein VFS21_08140 [Roseiflexaceae bacterium]|nr:hypothetical protein [Roseiflexaceae bacterium]
MFESLFPYLPDDLRLRLEAAGVTDGASLQQVLDANPELRSELETFIDENRPLIAQAILQSRFEEFVAAQDSAGLWAVWQQVPADLERAFLALLEARITQVEHAGDEQTAASLRLRLTRLQQLMEHFLTLGSRLQQWLDELVALSDNSQLPEFWNTIPNDSEDEFLGVVERGAEALAQAGDAEGAGRLRDRLALLCDLQARQRALGAQIRQWIDDLEAVADDDGLIEFWNKVPQEAEDLLLSAGDMQVGLAEQLADHARAELLRGLLRRLRTLQQRQRAVGAQVRQWISQLEVLGDDAQLQPFWNSIPPELEDTFLSAASAQAQSLAQTGEADRAARMRAQIARLHDIQERQHAAASDPMVQALQAFLTAETEEAARAVFGREGQLLSQPEAQVAIDQWAAGAREQLKHYFQTRAELLRDLREQG